MDSRGNQRREMMALKRVQIKLVACVCVPLAVTCLGVSFFLTYFFLSTLRSRGLFQSEYAAQVIPIAIWVAAITLFLMVSACFVLSVSVGHRIVGPMGRMAKRLEDMSAGTVRTGFAFRDGDDLAFVGAALGKVEARFHADLSALRDEAARLGGAAAALSQKAASADAETRDLAATVARSVEAISERLKTYHIV